MLHWFDVALLQAMPNCFDCPVAMLCHAVWAVAAAIGTVSSGVLPVWLSTLALFAC